MAVKKNISMINSNIEYTFKNDVKERRENELLIANAALAFENQEKEKRAAELIIANKELAFQNQEKEKRAEELISINEELKKAQVYQKEYIDGLKKMMFMTSHKVRLDIANILGISDLLDCSTNSPEEQKEFIECMKQSALSLDTFTKELTTFISELEQKVKK